MNREAPLRLTELSEIIPELAIRRKLLGLSYRTLADKMGVEVSSLFNWETEKHPPRVDLFFVWCEALDLNVKVVTAPAAIPRSPPGAGAQALRY